MAVIGTVFIGFIVGILAKFLMPGKDPGGFIITILLGIGGAFVASYIGQTLGWYLVGEPAGFFASILGAMLILFLYRMMVGRKA